MWNWKSPVIVLSMAGFLFGPGLSISFPKNMDRAGDDQYSVRPPDLHLGIGKPIGSRSDDDEDSNGAAIAQRSSSVRDLSEEEELCDRLGREMHLLQDMMHSSSDSSSLTPVSDQLSGE
jgi:hypothetical protein